MQLLQFSYYRSVSSGLFSLESWTNYYVYRNAFCIEYNVEASFQTSHITRKSLSFINYLANSITNLFEIRQISHVKLRISIKYDSARLWWAAQ
jgi:hypothetical protein